MPVIGHPTRFSWGSLPLITGLPRLYIQIRIMPFFFLKEVLSSYNEKIISTVPNSRFTQHNPII
jgi:hypothetical protein